MDALTLKDLESVQVEVTEVEFLGKRAYIRPLSFQAQLDLGRKFKGKEGDEATGEDMCYMIGSVLCDENGALIVPNPKDAVKLFNRVKSEDLLALFSQISDDNALDVEEEVKK